MYEAYIQKGTKRLRLGYTTGTCAAGAAKAAALMLLTGRPVDRISILVPAGDEIPLEVEDVTMAADAVSCAVRKDGGDDPDATDGMLIYARVCLMPDGRDVEIDGGEGIGRVTKRGLDQAVGEAAINSVPRQMIREGVREVMALTGCTCGLSVTIYAPEGAEIARRTFNPRLGIEGGISIIGTTGIVEPMSNDAILGTVKAELSVRRAQGERIALLTIGNYGSAYLAGHYPALSDKAVTCSNFIGDAIDMALGDGYEGILILGHFGKLVKLGAGIMNTHSAFADARMDVLTTCALSAGAGLDTLRAVADAPTTDAALAVLREAGDLDRTLQVLTDRVDAHLRRKVREAVPIGAVLFSQAAGITVGTDAAEALLEALQ